MTINIIAIHKLGLVYLLMKIFLLLNAYIHPNIEFLSPLFSGFVYFVLEVELVI